MSLLAKVKKERKYNSAYKRFDTDVCEASRETVQGRGGGGGKGGGRGEKGEGGEGDQGDQCLQCHAGDRVQDCLHITRTSSGEGKLGKSINCISVSKIYWCKFKKNWMR